MCKVYGSIRAGPNTDITDVVAIDNYRERMESSDPSQQSSQDIVSEEICPGHCLRACSSADRKSLVARPN